MALLLLLAGGLYFLHLWRGLYVDEYTTWMILQLPVADLITNRLEAGHLPGYFLGLKAFSQVLGESEVALRLPSLVMVLGAVAMFAGFAVELTGRRVGMLAAWLFAAHQLTIWTAQTARPYAPLLLLAVAGAWALLRWWQQGSILALAALFTTMLLGLANQPLHAAVLGGFLIPVAAGLRHAPRRAMPAGVVMVLAAAISVPLFRLLAGEQENFEEPEVGFPLGKLTDGLSRVYLGDFTFFWETDLLEILVQLILGFSIILVVWKCKGGNQDSQTQAAPDAEQQPPSAGGQGQDARAPGGFPAGWMLLGWIVVPLIVLTLMQGTGSKSVLAHERYYAGILPALMLLLALSWQALRCLPWPRQSKAAIAAGVLLIYGLSSAGWLLQRGDGPKVLVGRLPENAVLLGHVYVLDYETRYTQGHVLPFGQDADLDRLPAVLQQARTQYPEAPIWLVIYNNKNDPRDPFLQSSPGGWEITAREEYAHARAVQLEWVGEE